MQKTDYFTNYGPNGEPYKQYYRHFFNAEDICKEFKNLDWAVNSLVDFGCADGSTIRDFLAAGVPEARGYELQQIDPLDVTCPLHRWKQGDALTVVKQECCDVAYISFLMYLEKEQISDFIDNLHDCVNIGVVFQNLFKDDEEQHWVPYDPMRLPKEKLLTKDEFRLIMMSKGFCEVSFLDYWQKK